MSNIERLYPSNFTEFPDNLLREAMGNYDDLLMLGYNKNGELDIRCSSGIEKAHIVWMIEFFKVKLLRGDYD